ncbi:hypothetical protein F9B85_10965 [Heliorestis acidaminivorans]|uniref:Uncharacterized protein n=1 Tax=Heliorestis acidaminivorans TaxID=553427 RepID=A0A6I0EX82_9FIRM|nr:hypothetical protein [Heliorestis acidaminivorans]KAB2951804.1 hypothetical protein F9B85_10965 [Heliorestis acidaminivorans]
MLKQWMPKILKAIGIVVLLWGFYAGFQVLGTLDEVKAELGITEEVMMEASARGEEAVAELEALIDDDEALRELATLMWFYIMAGVMGFVLFFGGAYLLQKAWDEPEGTA